MSSGSEASVTGVQHLGPAEIIALFREAEFSPRKRAHLLLHRSHADQVQRLMIACCVGTYVRPHYHPEQWELMSLLEGDADVITFDADGRVTRRRSMQLGPVVQIAQNVLHTLIITAPRTLLLEVKPGPFRPTEFPRWAPEENSQGAARLLEQLKRPHTD
jgi:cupin fold WbuC family metalloprotein